MIRYPDKIRLLDQHGVLIAERECDVAIDEHTGNPFATAVWEKGEIRPGTVVAFVQKRYGGDWSDAEPASGTPHVHVVVPLDKFTVFSGPKDLPDEVEANELVCSDPTEEDVAVMSEDDLIRTLIEEIDSLRDRLAAAEMRIAAMERNR